MAELKELLIYVMPRPDELVLPYVERHLCTSKFKKSEVSAAGKMYFSKKSSEEGLKRMQFNAIDQHT